MKKLYPLSLAAMFLLAVFLYGCGGNTGGTPTPTTNVIHVKQDSPNPDGKGLTWDTAFHTIQAALNATQSGDQIWVAVGTYFERITLKDGIALYGGFTGTETILAQRNWQTHITVLDGQKGGPVVTANNLTSVVNRIDGFTIKNGLNDDGGGISCQGSVLTVNNNTINGNSAKISGGGIYCGNSSLTISNNNINGNSSGFGGGIYDDSSSIIINNIISNNNVSGYGQGGGIYCSGSSYITNNVIRGNTGYGGGGIYCTSSAQIINNTIVYNTCASVNSSGGIHIISNPVISNNIITGNDYHGIYTYAGGPILSHNCVIGNLSGDYVDVLHGTDINVDPKFIDYNNQNYRLQTGSPCIDAGDDSVSGVGKVELDGNQRRVGAHIDIGAYEWQGH